MAEKPTSARRAAADAVAVGPEGEPPSPAARKGGPGGADPLVGELRKGGLLSLLVLHEVSSGPSYGNQLIERVSEVTGGVIAVNPNTMYPLLRSLESQGQLEGSWEHPERRSRRFYAITEQGQLERERLALELGPKLDALAVAIDRIRSEVVDS